MDRFAIAIDLGGTQLRAALVDPSGKIHRRTSVATAARAGPDAVIEQITEAAKLISEGLTRAQIAGLGVSSPGPLDTVRGLALSIPTLSGFDTFPLRDALSARVEYPVTLENDGIAAALGEWRAGAGRGHDNLVYVTVSTGIGGGVVADGRLLRGRRGMAGHVGHMAIQRGGALCACGRNGCWEAYASGTAFARRAVERAAEAAGSALGAGGSRIDGHAVFAAAELADPLAMELVAEEADFLGAGITSLLHLYSPDLVILGGGMANGFDLMRDGIAARIEADAMPAFRDVKVTRAELGDNSGLVGAAMLAFSESETRQRL
jgi:glucokinase